MWTRLGKTARVRDGLEGRRGWGDHRSLSGTLCAKEHDAPLCTAHRNPLSLSQKVSSWLFPRATLWPGWTVQPTSDFLSKINAVTNQVTSNNSEAEAQAMALKKLFLEYGDQYPSKVTLGGKAYAIEESEQQADFSSTSVVETSSSGFNLLFVSASKSSGDDSYNSRSVSGGAGMHRKERGCQERLGSQLECVD